MNATITSPRVCVLMCVYNGQLYLRQAIESILSQTFKDYEFLIVNDGSTDNSRSIIASYDDPRIRILENEQNIGLTRSLNRGLAAATAELIARQDADDVSHATRLAKQVAFMDAHPEVAVVGAQMRIIDAQGRERAAYGWQKLCSEIGVRWQSIFDSPFVHSLALFRKHLVWDVEGGYNEEFRTSQDYELWSRLGQRYKMRNLPEILIDSRAHPDSVSANSTRSDVEKVRDVLRNNLQGNVPEYPWVEEWVDTWMSVLHRGACPPGSNARDLIRHLLLIKQMFEERHAEAVAEREIDPHFAGLLLRSARSILHSTCRGAAVLAWQARQFDVALTIRVVPRLIGKIMIDAITPAGWVRRGRKGQAY